MIVTRRFPMSRVLRWGLPTAIIGGTWATAVFALYAYGGLTFMRVPFLPIATVGTAVAFYIGFKNNAAYDRFWEGRKIWGGIVNASRTWGTAVMSYTDPGEKDDRAGETRRVLIYRHLAYINALRIQLRKTSRFMDNPHAVTKRRLEDHADHMRNDWDEEISPFLAKEEFAEVSARKNPATHMLARQGDDLARLELGGRLDMFRQLELMHLVEEFYALQGKCERIKNTPFPRQYAEFSRLFVRVFVFLVPLGLLDVFGASVDSATSTMETLTPLVPMFFSSALITWVFMTMEGIGDSSEDPFERSMNDVPMNALCRTIEIDLREMLGETELPEKEPLAGDLLY